ncbi:anti-FecI sigma factor FecR [Gluconacetobacter liquefaciens NRIC 0522]|uniref:DUF4880 domain-containing protein n=2 Tax=Gluconacetobacter liquefaciens TaxID=89584 RepID=A0A7W4PB57_GLULI|nr:FecR domain-containing protein [Gluconacetobacter liquefaciens]MBB2187215.1 DUF4880 domain-containing protein [Gluconacetobacter liquefaciens]GBQ99346.1 anti-FecI sigma factor FecR [Gluconacetobacter liquefaciens NRIC 0522]
MTDTPSDQNDGPTTEANMWVIRLTEDPDDPATRRAFAAWHGDAPAHAQAWARALRVWQLTGALSPALLALPVVEAPPATSSPTVTPPGRRRHPSPRATRRRRRTALSLAAAACVAGLFVLPDMQIALRADYTAPTGHDRTITLADGSIITLGAKSAIAVHDRPEGRDVTLLAGEAFFQVRHDAHRPFTVHAGTLRARDIGTRFDIRMDRAEIRVGVQDGTVGISTAPNSPETRLGSGDEIRLNRATGTLTQDQVAPDTIGSWTTGTLVVADDTADNVIETLRRYYPGFIVTWGGTLRSRHVGGVYDLHNIPAALRAAILPAGGHVRAIGHQILLATTARTPTDR